ncbi:hypothetical protein TSUD_293120 [Trifolium subterraneum]|uniref:Uncharacterized protein n=1 Tax=Trifolium subterraneum TaxID=3900 RepID=A0A2Z6MX19_TRISU|nr:hypothetical protein TSUD_293120 [Trifolium subterraneum]
MSEWRDYASSEPPINLDDARSRLVDDGIDYSHQLAKSDHSILYLLDTIEATLDQGPCDHKIKGGSDS